MNQTDIKEIVGELIQTFLDAGKISIDLREKGLIKEIKSDNTPVSNGDLEVNKILIKKISELTPNIPIISEETSDNKLINNLENLNQIPKFVSSPEISDYFFRHHISNHPNLHNFIHQSQSTAGLCQRLTNPSRPRITYLSAF